MVVQRLKQPDILEGNLFVQIARLSIPLMLTTLLQTFYTAADMMIVGLSGVEGAVGAIGITGSIVNVLVGGAIGFSVGTNVVVGRGIGARDAKRVERAVHTSLLLAVILGVFVGGIGIIFSRLLLKWLGAEGHILDMANVYMRYHFAGLPFGLVTNFAAAIFRAKGNTKIDLYINGTAGLLNVLLNLLFVLVLKMNVAGVAIATRIASAYSAVLFLWMLHREEDASRLVFKKLKLYGEELREILRVGVPTSIQSMVVHFSISMVQSTIVGLNNTICPGGSYVLDGHSAGASLESFVSAAANAVGTGSVTFVSQCYGAGKFDRIRKVMWNSYLLSFLISMAAAGIMLLFNDFLAGLYVSDPRAVEVVQLRNSIMMPFYFLVSFYLTNSALLRGIEHASVATIISLICLCAFRIFWVSVIFPIFPTLECIYLSYPASWLLNTFSGFLVSSILLNRKIKAAAERKAKLEAAL